jgi:hypothetical protein
VISLIVASIEGVEDIFAKQLLNGREKRTEGAQRFPRTRYTSTQANKIVRMEGHLPCTSSPRSIGAAPLPRASAKSDEVQRISRKHPKYLIPKSFVKVGEKGLLVGTLTTAFAAQEREPGISRFVPQCYV